MQCRVAVAWLDSIKRSYALHNTGGGWKMYQNWKRKFLLRHWHKPELAERGNKSGKSFFSFFILFALHPPTPDISASKKFLLQWKENIFGFAFQSHPNERKKIPKKWYNIKARHTHDGKRVESSSSRKWNSLFGIQFGGKAKGFRVLHRAKSRRETRARVGWGQKSAASAVKTRTARNK